MPGKTWTTLHEVAVAQYGFITGADAERVGVNRNTPGRRRSPHVKAGPSATPMSSSKVWPPTSMRRSPGRTP